MRWAWTFNFDLFDYNLAGVLWMIGWSMVVLAAVIWLPLSVVAALGLIVMFGHNLVRPVHPRASAGQRWKARSRGSGSCCTSADRSDIGGSGPRLVILYSLLPWMGVMAAGYAFGRVMEGDERERRRRCLAIGLGAIALFVVLRSFNLYGDPRPWSPPSNANGLPAALSFLNTTKYPASLLFLLMTLGPLIALLPLVEHARGAVANVLDVFGRVPLFYYVLHIPLIHVLAIAVSFVAYRRGHTVALWQPSDGAAAAAAGLHVEPGLALRRDARRGRTAVLRVPMVRRGEGAIEESVDEPDVAEEFQSSTVLVPKFQSSNPGTLEPWNLGTLEPWNLSTSPRSSRTARRRRWREGLSRLHPFDMCAKFHDVGLSPPPWRS